ncbi:MAG: hypothetical protein WC807_15205 [Hyphomicrobium sp.]|jgi:colicin import membrane protein
MARAIILTRAAILAAGLLLSAASVSWASDEAAHAIADKFSGAAEARARKAEEAEMLVRARKEAAARLTAAKKAAAEEEAAEEKRVAEEVAKKTEADRIAREAEAKRIADERRIAEDTAKKAEADRIAREAEAKRIAEEKRIAEDTAKKAEADRIAREAEYIALEAAREEKSLRLDQKLRALEASRLAKQNAPAEPPSPPMGLGSAPQAASSSEPQSQRVTVLLVMEPGTNGIRRFGQKTADPIICSGTSCWQSGGPSTPAKVLVRGLALGPGNTLGRRAASCNHRLGCVFRDIDLGTAPTILQPIDLRILHHDRRQPLMVERDPSCRVSSQGVLCDKLVQGIGWRAWVMLETVAKQAGDKLLEAAVSSNLTAPQQAASGNGIPSR